MIDYNPREGLTLAAAIMKDMKETDPDKHRRVSEKWQVILNDIVPNSCEGPPIRDFILGIVNDCK